MPSVATPDELARIVEMLPDATSLREIARKLDMRFDTVREAASPFVTLMRLNGSLAPCPCGRARFHPYGCKAKYSPADYTKFVPGYPPERTAELLERRRLVVEMIVAGHRFVDINSMLGLPHKAARHYLRWLTPEQMARRERAVRARKPRQSEWAIAA